MQNLHLTFDCMYCSQKLGEDFAKFRGLLRIYELYYEIRAFLTIIELHVQLLDTLERLDTFKDIFPLIFRMEHVTQMLNVKQEKALLQDHVQKVMEFVVSVSFFSFIFLRFKNLFTNSLFHKVTFDIL